MRGKCKILEIRLDHGGRANILNGIYDGCGAAGLIGEISRHCCGIDAEQMEPGMFMIRLAALERQSRGRRKVCLLGCMVDPNDLQEARLEARCLFCCEIFFRHYMFLRQGWMARHLVRAVWEVAVEVNSAAAVEERSPLMRWIGRC